MAAGNVTITTAANFIPEVWAAGTLKAIEHKLVMANLVLKQYSEDVKAFGDVVHINYFQNVTIGDKGAGTIMTYSNETEGKIDLTVDKHKYGAVRIDDIAEAQAKPNIRDGYTQKIGYGLAKAIDTDLLTLYSGVATTKGYTTSKITLATLLDVVEHFDDNDVPAEGRNLVVSAAQKRALLEITEIIRSDYNGGMAPLKSANIGSFLGMNIFWSNNVVKTGTTPTVSHNLAFHQEAFALVMQMSPRMKTSWDHDYLAWKVSGDAFYGVGEVKDDTTLGKYAVHVQAQDLA